MARRSQHSFLKRQKEIKRKDTAVEKMARRQSKADQPKGAEEFGQPKGAEGNEEQSNDANNELGS
jgi:hypothetical protein